MSSIQEQLSAAANHFNAGNVPEAERLCREALLRDPLNVVALRILGMAARHHGDYKRSLELIGQAVGLNPTNPVFHFERASTLTAMERDTEAYETLLHVMQLKSDFQPGALNIGAILQKHECWEESLPWTRMAARLKPDCAMSHYNLANALRELGRIDEANEHSLRTIELNSSYRKAQWNLGMCYLLQGDYARAWPLFELREACEEVFFDRFTEPRWDGSSLDGKTIVVHAEQGIGDEVLFASCFPDVIGLAEHVIIVCEPRLKNLFARSFPAATIHPYLRRKDWSPPKIKQKFDVQIPAGSLPLHFRTSLAQFPQRERFLLPDPQLKTVWKNRFDELGRGLKVGISWQAGGKPAERRKRSIPLDQWAELLGVPSVHFINLQYSDAMQDIADVKEQLGVEIHDWTDGDPLIDMDSYAAKIAALDLVISVGNATVHLAGALGTPAWTLLPMVPSWRWMVAGDRSPWYQTVHLFRQRERNNWDGVIAELVPRLYERAGVVAPVRVRQAAQASKQIRPAFVESDVPDANASIPWLAPDDSIIKCTPETLASMCEKALAQFEAGELAAAEKLYRRVIKAVPRHVKALAGLGRIARQDGRTELAIRSLTRSLAMIEPIAEHHTLLAGALADAGRIEEAMKSYQRALELDPRCPGAVTELGLLLQKSNQHQDAAQMFRRALGQSPDEAAAYVHLGRSLAATCQLDMAIECYQKALGLSPNDPAALVGVADAYLEDQRYDEAEAALRQAIAVDGASVEARCKLGGVLHAASRRGEAIDEYRQALELDPRHVPALKQLGAIERELGKLDDCVNHLSRALELDNADPQIVNLLGMAYQDQGALRGAIECFDKAIELAPNFAIAHANRAMALLQSERFEEGWCEYEWRWHCAEASRPRNHFTQPLWDGGSLAEKTILIHGEQAIGDELMFASCYREVIAQAGRVLITCEPRMEKLFRRSFPTATVYAVSRGREHLWRIPSGETVDVQIPAGSLPRYLRTSIDRFPRDSFLVAEAAKTILWHERLAARGSGLKIGISWRAGDTPEERRLRSTELAMWAPLLAVPGVTWVNVQHGDCRQEIERAAQLATVSIQHGFDFDPRQDLDTLAAQLSALDLVITVGNTTAHLAGALGVPTWVLLPSQATWRWLMNREDSPWYGIAQLLRQQRPGDWSELIVRARNKLLNRKTRPDEESWGMRGATGWNQSIPPSPQRKRVS